MSNLKLSFYKLIHKLRDYLSILPKSSEEKFKSAVNKLDSGLWLIQTLQKRVREKDARYKKDALTLYHL